MTMAISTTDWAGRTAHILRLEAVVIDLDTRIAVSVSLPGRQLVVASTMPKVSKKA